MEPLFTVTRVMTEKYARELFRNINYMYHLFYILFMIIPIAYTVYWAYWYYELNITFVIVFILELIAYLYRPYTVGKNRIKEYKALYNAPETDNYMFYEDYLINTDIYSKSEIKVEYSNITSVKTTKNFYVFSIKNSKTKLAVPKNIDNDSKQAEFIDFVNSKIVNSKKKLK